MQMSLFSSKESARIAGLVLLIIVISVNCTAQSKCAAYTVVENISYKNDNLSSSYISERCKLDVYSCDTLKNVPVVVWFHGGGLTSGSKYIPDELKDKGIVVVAVNYRLLPRVNIDECLDDCAAAVAWVFGNVLRFGGNKRSIYLSGHSAGGYITAMLGLDKTLLARYGVDADSIKALVPFSGQMISHFAYRDMNGIGNLQPLVDKFAPLFHVRPNCPPLVLITGDAETELLGRYEENLYMWRMMKLCGHTATSIYKIDGHDHGAMCHPAFYILLHTIAKYR